MSGGWNFEIGDMDGDRMDDHFIQCNNKLE